MRRAHLAIVLACTVVASGCELIDALGLDRKNSYDEPTPISISLQFSAIAASATHTCAADVAGNTFCWGSNRRGELGTTADMERCAPIGISAFECSGRPVGISGDAKFVALALTESDNGAWSCGLTSEGQAYCWGYGVIGGLGDGTTSTRTTPAPVSGSQRYTKLRSAGGATCGLTSAGALYCWGSNGAGLFGNGNTTSSNVPVRGGTGVVLQSIEMSRTHACGLTAAGVAYCWGGQLYGALGRGGIGGASTAARTPAAVTGGLLFKQIAVGRRVTCGLTTSDETYCWGFAPVAPTAEGVPEIASPARVATATPFISLHSTQDGMCGRTAPGLVWCWGEGWGSVVGGAPGATMAVPTRLATGAAFATVAVVPRCALTGTGIAYCWGDNDVGQAGQPPYYGR